MTAPHRSISLVASASERLPPYPPDTKAKGWRFELDYERIEQSDTWALAPPEMRPWLLMTWMTAWRQAPCGSLPASDELIAARIGMEIRQFKAHRDILLRGWWVAADGRMYHPVISEQVLRLAEARVREATRKQQWRDQKNQGLAKPGPVDVPRDTIGTPASATTPEPEPEPLQDKKDNTAPPTPRRRSAPAEAIAIMVADGVSVEAAEGWMTVRKAKRMPLTKLAWDEVKRHAEKLALTNDEAVRIAVKESWAGFRASWVEKLRAEEKGTKSPNSKSIAGMNYNEGFDEHGRIL